jgi:hypothetical protein
LQIDDGELIKLTVSNELIRDWWWSVGADADRLRGVPGVQLEQESEAAAAAAAAE